MRAFFIFLAVVVTAMTFFSALRYRSHTIEEDITARVSEGLAAEGATNVDVDVDGRHVNLSGIVPGAEEEQSYLRVADETFGALGPIDGLIYQSGAGYISASKSDEGITLRGSVPDEAARDALLETAQTVTDGAVVDELTIAGGAEPWQDEALFGLSQMDALATGSLTATAGVYSLSGAALDDPAPLRAEVAEREGWSAFISDPNAPLEIRRLEGEVALRDDRLAELEDRAATLEGSLADANTVIGTVTGERDDLQVELDALRANLSDGEANVGNLQAQLLSLQGTIADRDASVADLTDDLAAANAIASAETNRADALEGVVADRDAIIAELQSDLTSLGGVDDQVAALRAQLGDADGTITELNGQIAERDSTIADLTGSLSAADADLSSVTAALGDAEGTISGLRGDIAGLTSELADRDAEIVDLTAALADRDGAISDLTGALSVAEADVSSVTATLGGAQGTISSLRGEITGLTSDVADRDAIIDGLNGQLAERDAQIGDLTGELSDAGSEVTRLRGLLDTAGEQGTQLAALEDEVSTLNATIAERDATIARLRNQPNAGLVAEQCALQATNVLADAQINFDVGTAVIDTQSVPLLERITGIALACLDEGLTVEIGGHTDDRGSDEDNQELSEARAEAVLTFMTERGVDVAGLRSRGFGETQPIADNDTQEGRAANRRISFDWLAQ